MGKRRAYFLPTSCFQSTVRVDPYPLGRENPEDTLQFSDHFLRARHARRVDIIDAKADVVWVAIGNEGLQQLKLRTRGFDQSHVGVHAGNVLYDIVKLRVAQVRVDLCGVLHGARGETETEHGPVEIVLPVRMPQGQPLTQGWLVDLNHAHASRFQILHFVAYGQSDLPTRVRAWLIITHKGPLHDGHRPREHALHGARRERLSKLRPLHRHGMRTCHVAIDDGRTDTERSVALHPALLGEQHPGELLTEIFDHITALELAMHQHIQSDLFLEADYVLDLLLEERFIALTIHLAALIGSTSRTDLRCLRVGTQRRRWQRRKVEDRLLLLFALMMSMRALCHLLVDHMLAMGHLLAVNTR